eukprot:CAMPEP_0178468420 /NCGR_PEP_ID=MMETSP0689_2-20121128/52908_1 /TAXON_ID=160604 /ORGANISM="Amphidinium massartii, Strain CS-259" /LENGTH=202 /DNA_ID=CAMNT_0020095471 /DNA_START=789 /DNA_END=1398 /DNA_ORIENTATION=-
MQRLAQSTDPASNLEHIAWLAQVTAKKVESTPFACNATFIASPFLVSRHSSNSFLGLNLANCSVKCLPTPAVQPVTNITLPVTPSSPALDSPNAVFPFRFEDELPGLLGLPGSLLPLGWGARQPRLSWHPFSRAARASAAISLCTITADGSQQPLEVDNRALLPQNQLLNHPDLLLPGSVVLRGAAEDLCPGAGCGAVVLVP